MLRMTPIASAVLLLLLGIDAHAAEETFDTNFMMGGMKGERVSDFRLDDNQPLPGQYDIDIYVNKQWRGKYDITVKDNPDDTCLSRDALTRLGINIQALDKQNECPTLKQAVQGGSYAWNIGTFRLDLSVPQAFVDELEQGYVPPENWDRGINAFYTSYYASQYYSDYKDSGNSKSTYARFTSGLNLLGWQLHSDASYNKTDDSSGEWKSNTLYLERGIPQILGTLRAGDMYTSSDILMRCVFVAYGCIAICRCCRTQNRILRRWCRGLRKVTRWSPSNRTVLWFTRKRFRQARSLLRIYSWQAAVRILMLASKRLTDR